MKALSSILVNKQKMAVLCIACISFSITCPALDAQNKKARQAKIDGNIGGLFEGTDTAGTPEKMQSLLRMHIEEMQAIAKLDEKQAGKLKLTAKVVAKKVLEENKPMLAPPFGIKQGSAEVEESFSDEDSESRTDQAALVNPLKEIRMPVPLKVALNHKAWTKALSSILSQDQKASLREYRENRNRKIRDVAVQYRVWQLAERLRLSEIQTQTLTDIVDRIEGDELVKKLRRGQGGMGPAVLVARGANKPKTVGPDDVKDILTELQMVVFENKKGGGGGMGGLGALLGLNKKANEAQTIAGFGFELDSESDRLTVKKVTKDSPAEKLGVQVADVIDEINSEPVDTPLQIEQAMKKADAVSATILRDGKSIVLESDE